MPGAAAVPPSPSLRRLQGNPYVGAKPLGEDDHIYGRVAEIREVRNLLKAARVVLLHSVSGVGKSSLIAAGVVPAIANEGIVVFPTVLIETPGLKTPEGNPYLFSLAQSLGFPPSSSLSEALATGNYSLDAFLNDWRGVHDLEHSRGVLLVIDQFEEIFSDPTAEGHRKAFFRQLGTALRNRNLFLLLAMREEFLAQFETYIDVFPGSLPRRFHLKPLSFGAAEQAITAPAHAKGAKFESEIVPTIISDLQRIKVRLPDGSMVNRKTELVLPFFLQVACFELWNVSEKRNPPGTERIIGLADWSEVRDDLGLTKYYDAQVREAADASHSEAMIRWWIATNLIVNGVRAPVVENSPKVDELSPQILQDLTRRFLVRYLDHGETKWYELAHDRLVTIVTEANQRWFQQFPLVGRAQRWKDAGENPRDLLNFREFLKLRKSGTGLPLEERFRSLSRKRLTNRLIGAFCAFSLLVALLWIVGRLAIFNDWVAELLDLQNEVQTRTYHEVVEEIDPNLRGDISLNWRFVPKDPENWDTAIRPAQRAAAWSALSRLPLQASGRPVSIQLENGRIAPLADSILRARFFRFGAESNRSTGHFVNALTFGDSVPIERVREIAYVLWAADHPVSRIRYAYKPYSDAEPAQITRAAVDPFVVRLSYEGYLQDWYPPRVEQIDSFFVPPHIRARVEGK